MSIKKELYCYLRVSSKVQEEEGHSIDNQRFLGKRISKKLGMKYVEMNEGHYSTQTIENKWTHVVVTFSDIPSGYFVKLQSSIDVPCPGRLFALT